MTFQTETLTEESSTELFEQNPEVAAMLWHMNSGSDRFEMVDQLIALDPTSDEFRETMDKLLELIQAEALTDCEKDSLVSTFHKAQGRGGTNPLFLIHQTVTFQLFLHPTTVPFDVCSLWAPRLCHCAPIQRDAFSRS